MIQSTVRLILKKLTSMTNKQAYLMGFTYNSESSDVTNFDQRMSRDDLNIAISENSDTIKVFNFCDPSVLHGNRVCDFIRGFFDKNGTIDELQHIASMPIEILPECISKHIDAVCDNDNIWTGVNGMELLAFMYYPGCQYFLLDNQLSFSRWCDTLSWGKVGIDTFKWMKMDEEAVPPTKNRFSDSGYDLTLIKKIKEYNGVCYYDTGIAVEPPTGYYFEIVGRSSISKTGWMLANNVGIIDASYRGSIIVALVKVNNNVEEIQLPKRLVQLIPRRLHIFNALQVQKLTSTKRNEGGFGSSG